MRYQDFQDFDAFASAVRDVDSVMLLQNQSAVFGASATSTFLKSMFKWDGWVAATLLKANHRRMDMCSTCPSQTHAHTRQTEQFWLKIHS